MVHVSYYIYQDLSLETSIYIMHSFLSNNFEVTYYNYYAQYLIRPKFIT